MGRMLLRRLLFLLLFFFLMPLRLWAAGPLAMADSLFEQGGAENVLKAANAYALLSDRDPGHYDAAWKASRAYCDHCSISKQEGRKGWEAVCRKYGALGMKYGEKAASINPNRVEGHFWYGCSVGSYSDGVSILTYPQGGAARQDAGKFREVIRVEQALQQGRSGKSPWPLLVRPALAPEQKGQGPRLSARVSEALSRRRGGPGLSGRGTHRQGEQARGMGPS